MAGRKPSARLTLAKLVDRHIVLPCGMTERNSSANQGEPALLASQNRAAVESTPPVFHFADAEKGEWSLKASLGAPLMFQSFGQLAVQLWLDSL